jgi:hypothetical protein
MLHGNGSINHALCAVCRYNRADLAELRFDAVYAGEVQGEIVGDLQMYMDF